MIDRTKSGGASEVAALFGCHPFVSEYSLFCQKTGLSPPQEDTERLNAGRFLEPAILAEFNRQQECGFAHNTEVKRYSERISATPDGIQGHPAFSTVSVADVKTVLPFMAEHWKDGTPEYIKLQLKQQMLCANADKAVTIAMFGFSNPRHEWTERNTDDDAKIIAAWDTFWQRVDGKLPPPNVDGHRATTAVLAAQKPQASVIELGPEVWDWSTELNVLKALAKKHSPRVKELENKIRHAMGKNSTGVFVDGTGYRLIPISESTSTRKAHFQMRFIKGKEAVQAQEDFE